MKQALVSIIIPVYNVEQYLRECLDSVVNQTLSEIEIICINDGSTDASPEILNEYASKDSRIKIISQQNSGLSKARNAALEIASGEYVTFLDSDDYFSLDALEKLYEKASSEQLDLLLFCAQAFCDNNISTSQGYEYTLCPDTLTRTVPGIEFFVKSIDSNNHIGTATQKLYKTDFLKKNNFKFIDGIFHEDEPFYYETILEAHRVCKIPNHFYFRRYRSDSIMTTRKNSKHILGRLIGITRILEISKAKAITGKALSATMSHISVIATNLSREYYTLEDTEKEKLASLPYEQYHFLQLLVHLSKGERLSIIESSFSFRLGLFLTAPFRWIAGKFCK